MKRLLITGAAGGLGTVCRKRLTHMADILRLADITELADVSTNEEVVQCDLKDRDAVDAMVADCDGIVHLGGRATEGNWTTIRDANIEGMFNLYEAARKHGVKRILFASSNHVIGYYEQTERLDSKSTPRPDSLYGVSKAFGEALASMYHDKFGIETACLRIGSCFTEPKDHRMLSTWMSYDDFVRLIERVFSIPRLGCPIIYGASANDAVWWDNRDVAYLGWQPKDNSEVFREKVDLNVPAPRADAPDVVYQGGMYTADDVDNS